MGIRQGELARRLGVSQGMISKLETGKTQISHVRTGRFKSVLGKHFEYFLTGEGKEIYEKYRHVSIDRHGNVVS